MHRAAGILFVGALLGAPCAAQEIQLSNAPAGEFAIGLSLNAFGPHAGDSQPEFGDTGWTMAPAINLSDHIGIAAEFGSARNVHMLLAGPRLFTRLNDHGSTTQVFGQVLTGAEVSEMAPGGFAVQPSAGLDIISPLRHIGFRIELGYCYVRGGNAAAHQLSGSRALFGVVFEIGDR